MVLSINAKIIGRSKIAEPGGASRKARIGALAAFVVVGYSPFLPAADRFDRSSFSRIAFSEGCSRKQWMLAPDNSLELLVAPVPNGECEITLPFYEAQNTEELSALAFEARSTHAGPFLKVGIQEDSADSVVYTSAFPSGGLGTKWMRDGIRMGHMREGWTPRRVNALHFIVIANSSSRMRSNDTVMIRHIRFAGSPLASPAPPTHEPATPVQTKVLPAALPVVAPVIIASENASTPLGSAFRWFVLHLQTLSHLLIKGLLAMMGLSLLAFALSGKSRRRRILSPLYEINMRTWKTKRDPHDVIEFGGFKNITLNDLKGIKQAGFNTIWLMGIWEVGAKVRDISKNYADDFKGSPFAIYDYAVSADLGTEQEFQDTVERAHHQRLSVIVDFIPNHMGLDSAWLNEHPEFFIHRVLDVSEADIPDDELKQRYPGFFPYRTPSYPAGERRVPKTIMVAYGKDPYFYPWIDTAQLDYAHPGLRQRMIDILCKWAKVVDGVRCDMAMLTLREQVKIHRHPEMSWDTFNNLMPHEFWTEAIHAVKRVNPNFVFMAETYWSMEGALQKLGFDYTYNKPLYEAICSAVHSGHSEGLMNFLRLLGSDFLKRSVHFIENHDEERAMNALGDERQRAAAAILCTLPGVALLHQGQMEGKRERLPVQRVIPLHQEPVHQALHNFYKGLLKATSLPVFQEGRLIPLYSNNPALASYVRIENDTKVLVVVNTSQRKQTGSVSLMPGLGLHSGTQYRLNDLFYSFKSNTAGTVQPFYVYPGSKLMNSGLYVELEAYDAHIFMVEARGAMPATHKALRATRQTLEEWPLNRVARRFLGAAFTRSSDLSAERQVSPLAANPASRQQ